ncbi:uncharacterized protein LOC111269300 isoform X1 [Varroa jacobsoni]|uniref:C2H2-type domain-containing protein n=2 Tax=Varroa destructor TaxID=109461 RepID=A0A7M7KPD4_VARDE|nr:uncharacterized protein LOC111251565 isoform X1 [Varroa destructor]XP_022704501.1 uncharacterized protein LOC111269300 isoform X1 [Varroa jacobsoni]
MKDLDQQQGPSSSQAQSSHNDAEGAPVSPQMRKAGGRRKNLECPGCAKAYSSVVSLQEHIRRAHPDVSNELHNIVKAGQWRCTQFPCVMGAAGCMEVCKSRNELLRHLESHHGIVVDWIESRFQSLSEFDAYRVSLRSKGHFLIKATSRRKGRTESEEPFILFRCNREGQKVDRKNRGDSRNSIKIGTFCTAYLKIFFQKDDTIRCMGSLTHCNHNINYKVKQLDGNISGRLQVIDDDDPEAEGVQMEAVEGAEEGQVPMEEMQVMQAEGIQDGEVQYQMVRPPPREMHVVHEQIPDEMAADGEEAGHHMEQHQVQMQTSEHENEGPMLVVTQEDCSAHQSLNALVEDSIWKMQMIQSERSGQRLIFYADALQQMIRAAHETISKTIMDHLQRNKRRQALANQQIQQTQMQHM